MLPAVKIIIEKAQFRKELIFFQLFSKSLNVNLLRISLRSEFYGRNISDQGQLFTHLTSLFGSACIYPSGGFQERQISKGVFLDSTASQNHWRKCNENVNFSEDKIYHSADQRCSRERISLSPHVPSYLFDTSAEPVSEYLLYVLWGQLKCHSDEMIGK